MNLDRKYRPKKFEDFIGNKNIVTDIQSLLRVGDIPHIMLVGPPGTGKTTLAYIIASQYLGENIGLNTGDGKADFMELNASSERGIETVRQKISVFAKTRSETFGEDGIRKKRICLVQESDSTTREFQHALRAVIEPFEDRCLFIFTMNRIEGIKEPALISRCAVFFLKRPTTEECVVFFKKVSGMENVMYENDEILHDIATHYKGDLRHMLNDCLEVLRGIDGVIGKENLWKIYNNSNKSVAGRVYESKTPRYTFFEIFKTEAFDVRIFLEDLYDLLGDESLEVSKAFAIVDARLRDNCSEVVQINYLFSLLESVKV